MSTAGNILLSNPPSWILPGASLDLNFANSQYFQQGVGNSVSQLTTTTRSSVGYVDDTAGNWVSVPANTPRISNKGLLVEEARTNGIRNNSMQGASNPSTLPTNWVFTNQAGLTLTVVGTGVENGIDYIDIRLNGTTNAVGINPVFESGFVIAAAQTQVWIQSVFMKLVGGDFTNVTAIFCGMQTFDNVGPTLLTNYQGPSITTPTSASLGSQRFNSGATTIGDATAAWVRPRMGFTVNNASAVDFTIRFGWPQLEQGASVTSPIRTTNAAATRASDLVKLASVPVFASTNTVVATSMWPVLPTSGFPRVLSINDGTSTNREELYTSAANGHAVNVYNGGVSQWDANSGGTITAGAIQKWGQALAPSSFSSAYNGTAGLAQASGTSPAAALTNLNFGGAFDTSVQSARYISRVALWPTTCLSMATLQALTT